jgi:hypothetical protein
MKIFVIYKLLLVTNSSKEVASKQLNQYMPLHFSQFRMLSSYTMYIPQLVPKFNKHVLLDDATVK